MADTRGTWSLSEAWAEKSAAEWVPVPNVWVQDALEDAGYIAGGQSPSEYLSRYDKIAYGSDTKTTVPGATLSKKLGGLAGTSSPTAGYTGGGYESPPGSPASTVDKLTYATQTSSAVPGDLGDDKTWMLSAGGSSTVGYWVQGGLSPQGSDIRKITYSTDTISTVPANMPNPVGNNNQSGAAGNGDEYLIIMGGSQGAGSEVKKLTYSTETGSNLPNMATRNRVNRPGCTSSELAVYVAGGTPSDAVDKLTFSNDTTSSVTTMGSPGRTRVTGTGSPSVGYFAGGSDLSIVNKITISDESCSRVPALDMSSGLQDAGAFSAKGDNRGAPNPKRWFDESSESPNISWIPYGGTLGDSSYRLDLSTETGADNPSSKMYWARNRLAATGNKTAGYFSSGYYQGSTPYVRSVTDKLVYSNDTNSRLPGSPLPGINGMQYHSAISSETDAYFWAGLKEYPTVYNWSKIYKFTYSTDAMSTHPSNMTGSNYRGASTNSATAGYETGGATLGQSAMKFTFSTGTAETKSGFMNDAPSPRLYTSGTGTQTAGYYAGGNGYTYVAKVTWSTETAEFTPGHLSGGGQRKNATSNTEKGYWIGGYPTPSGVTDVTTFSTDTTARNPSMEALSPAFTSQNNIIMASVGGRQSGIPVTVMPTATPTSTSSGPEEKGYILGGNPGPLSLVDKLQFSTETFTNVTNSSGNNKRQGGHGNTTTGYFSSKASPVGSSTEKLVYSTETRTTIPANLTSSRAYSKSISNNTQGYIGPGSTAPSKRSINKMIYATEAISSVPQMDVNRHSRYATFGNQTQGYWAVGSTAPDPQYYWSSVSKTTYSNDSTANVPGYGFSGGSVSPSARGVTFAFAASNGTLGYLCGGEQSPGATVVNKFTMSNDTGSRVPSADLVAHRYSLQGMNSSSKAYFTGGSPGNRSNTQILTFASDTTALSATGNVSTPGRSGFGAAGPNQRGNDPIPNVI